MKPPDDVRGDLIASAALGALMEARWHAQDLPSRKPRELAPDLLRGLAGEKAFSPLARDQVLSVALGLAADRLEQGGDLQAIGALDVLERLEPVEADRLAIRREVFADGSPPTMESRRVVETLVSRYGADCRSAAELAKRLRDEASLQELLWDHPGLPCDSRTRLVMLFSVPALLERAAEFDPKGGRAGWRTAGLAARREGAHDRALGGLFAARGWLRRPLLGLVPAGWLAGAGLVLAGLFAEGWA